ncbi:hypothetical protein BY996DRAFT_6559682 [Phakopsora pachyrhizi]|nr:hypothetical protein BY996DRAFT_6559682 [Phakopsora pachyrhizi]
MYYLEDDPVGWDEDLFDQADQICRKANLKSLEDLGEVKGTGYTDSSWAENDLKQSTTEYRAYLSAAPEAKWIRKMLEDT